MTRRLVQNPPETLEEISYLYRFPLHLVQDLFDQLQSIELCNLVIETMVSRNLPLNTALYLMKAEWMLT